MNCRLALASILLCVAPAFAAEGMWTLDQFGDGMPLDVMHEAGLSERPEAIRPLGRAVVRVSGGGTASFVSSEGLLLTNHHVAYDCIAANSRPGADLIATGFTAKAREAELPCAGLELYQPVTRRDVTDEIVKPEDAKLPALEVKRAREARRTKLAAACQAAGADLRCEVVAFHGGARETLITYALLRDVRLVQAPENVLPNFGGDADNFEWPRHAADYTFLRAYVAPGGAARAYDKSNVPYRSDTFLDLSLDGYGNGSYVMAMGYPAHTQRFLPAPLLAQAVEQDFPAKLERRRIGLTIFDRFAKTGEAARLADAARRAYYANSFKAHTGILEALGRTGIVAKRRASDAELAAWIAADPARKAAAGDALPAIARLVALDEKDRARRNATTMLRDLSQTVVWAYDLYERAAERAKPDAERHAGFHEHEDAALLARIVDDPAQPFPAAEVELLAAGIRAALALPATQRIAAVDALAKGRTGTPDALAATVARSVLEESKAADPATRRAWAAKTRAELDAVADGALRFAAALYREVRPREDLREREILAPLEEATRRVMVARLAKEPGLYADANETLRFTWGTVSGFNPPRGSRRGYATTIAGLLAASNDWKDYTLREDVVVQLSGQPLPMFVDRDLNTELVDFVADIDTTGGNSGSPALDGRGHLIGLLFDGNYEGLAGDLVFEPQYNRSILVDVRFILDLLVRVYGAGNIATEMGLR